MGRSKIGASALSQPSDQADDTLITLLAFDEGWAVVVFVRIRNAVDWEAGVVWSGV
jgi:hypothetical protein